MLILKKVTFLVVLVLTFAVGLAGTVLFQKLYGVDRVLRDLGIRNQLTDQLSGRNEVKLPPRKRKMVALAFGQSNSANYGKARTASQLATYNIYQGRFYHARDPMIGADGMGGSVWPVLGDLLQQLGLFDVVVFATIGVGQSTIARWAPGGDLHPKLMQALDDFDDVGLVVTHLLWHQGESDASAGTNPESYRRAFDALLQSIRERGIHAPIYVSITTRCFENGPDIAIRSVQQSLVDIAAEIEQGPDTDILGPEFRYDRCHFSEKGLAASSELWLQALSAEMPKPH